MTDSEVEKLQFLLKQRELELQEQLQIINVADNKAVALGSCFLLFSGALLAATAAFWTAIYDVPILVAGIFGVIVSWLSSALCFWPVRSINNRSFGDDLENVDDEIQNSNVLLLRNRLEQCNYYIIDNDNTIKKVNKFVNWGIYISLLVIVLAFLVWIITNLFFNL